MLRVNFSEYRRWIPKETFYEIVATGQQLEQLYVPGSKEPHILAYQHLKSKFCMTRLVPNFSDSSMYTLFEQRIWSGTEFTFTWPNLRVEELYPPSIQMDPELCPLRKEDFCIHALGDFASRLCESYDELHFGDRMELWNAYPGSGLYG